MASVCRFVSASLATLHWQCPWVFWVGGVPVVICAGANPSGASQGGVFNPGTVLNLRSNSLQKRGLAR